MEDLIKREDAIKALGERPLNWCGTPEECQAESDWDMYKSAIESIPTAEPKQGEWKVHGEPPIYVKECSACGAKFFHHAMEDLTPYCAMCGARMTDKDYESAVEQMEHDTTWEPTYNADDGSM